ncbi:MAG TPA: quinone-dependent dihydroorotate dehydrogenase [Candidatus Coprenecus pullistercoris]|nr:quinone-dependent dihydroorotate dehydrogenase [Candidatus Coprenecus pullistercoris]
MYRLIRKILFSFSAETAHAITFRLLHILHYIPFARSIIKAIYRVRDKDGELRREVFGLSFKNPVGMAAGLDKNGEFYNDLGNFGFSFVEIGSLTPEAQPGNPKPRLFRLIEDNAIINRMGINNKGVKYTVAQLQKHAPNVIIGGNIAKASTTPNDEAYKDYERAFSLLYDYVDYFTVNVSCPNVKDLTVLQDVGYLSDIIDRLLTLRRYYDEYRPILLKISPDIPYDHVDRIVELALTSGLDGIIATNTTNSREGLNTDAQKLSSIGNGGLSGQPLYEKSLAMVRYIHRKTNGILPIIGVGGIMTPEQAKEMLDAGASLIQIYTGFIYNGPGFVRRILKYLKSHK